MLQLRLRQSPWFLVAMMLNELVSATTSIHTNGARGQTPSFYLSDKGIRLDDISEALRGKVLSVLETALSPEGYQKAIGAMRVNGFLGDLVQAPAVMNEFSYNFVLFGNGPSEDKPWGLSFYGHHLCLNAFFYKSQMVLSPWLTGAEPNLIDSGPYKGTRILDVEERLGLQLMQSFSPELQTRVQTYEKMKDPAMPHGRWNHDDQRHLCGAYRDNRVVPYEGILVSEMSSSQIDLINGIVEQYLLFLPYKSRELRARAIADDYHETYFSWIGGYGNDNEPFYYRLQSPVAILEFDHHSGVFLTNKEPARFHIHTLLRTPNAGDYGMVLRPLINRMEQGYVWEGERE